MLKNIIATLLLIQTVSCSKNPNLIFKRDKPVAINLITLPDRINISFNSYMEKSDSLDFRKHSKSEIEKTLNAFYSVQYNKIESGDDYINILLLRSFDPPIMFKITRAKHHCRIEFLKLEKEIRTKEDLEIIDSSLLEHYIGENIKTIDTVLNGKTYKNISILGKTESVNLTNQSVTEISNKTFNQFTDSLIAGNIWNEPEYYFEGYSDGAIWFFDVKINNQQKYFFRQSPENALFGLGKKLVYLLDLEERIY